MNKTKVLITGACGVTSRSIVRSLLLSKRFKHSIFIGTDICDNKYALYEGLYNKIYCIPKCSSPHYRKTMNRIIEVEGIDAAIVVPELEVLYWSRNPFKVKSFLPPPKFCSIAINKKSLYDTLKNSGYVPKYIHYKRNQLLKKQLKIPFKFPVWIRDYQPGSTSGKGSFLAKNYKQLNAWVIINEQIRSFLLSEYLPGKNYACFLLYSEGILLKTALIERLQYIMRKVSISGITGNASIARIIDKPLITHIAKTAIELIYQTTKEKMNGVITVDMKEDYKENPLITEVNIRHIALTSSLAQAGFNISEFHLLCALSQVSKISHSIESESLSTNLVLRDVDGTPIYIENYP